MSIRSRLKNAFDVFINGEQQYREVFKDVGPGYSYRMDRPTYSRSSVKTIINSIFNRISMDCASIEVRHVRLDENGNFLEELNTSLNNCFSVEANIDQTGRAFFQDAVYSLLDEGSIAIVPTFTSENQFRTTPGAYDIYALRVGKITEWFPQHVNVNLYDIRTGQKKDIILSKEQVAIVESPLYSIINGPNSTMKRLIQKLALLDEQDIKNNSGRLDILIHNPFLTNTEIKRKQAEIRRNDIIKQLSDSSYGIAYIDGTEKVTQLNRSIESSLPKQVEYLTSMLFSQLGMTQAILDGTADEKTMNNYYNRVCEPIMIAIAESMYRRFLTPTARTQHQSIKLFYSPLKLMTPTDVANVADTLSRNAILTSNELRGVLGLKPSIDAGADVLSNKNIKQDMAAEEIGGDEDEGEESDEDGLEDIDDDEINELADMYSGMSDDELDEYLTNIDDLDAQLDEILRELDSDEELEHTGARGGTYASPYYDPEKAHEYYEAHKELKGRTSTAGLNEKGREAARYVREKLNSERKNVVGAHKSQTDQNVSSSNTKRKTKSEYINNLIKEKIQYSRDKRKEEANRYKDETQNKINSIRDEIKQKFSSERYKSLTAEQKVKFKEEKAKFAAKVKSEIEGLRADNKAERTRLTEEHKKAASLLNAKRKKHLSDYRAENKQEVTDYRNTHKEFRNTTKQLYDDKYAEEIEKIRSDPEMLKQKKTKSSSTKS